MIKQIGRIFKQPFGRSKAVGGFTIVETMIVLALAALILFIILIAVPDLQRSGRNSSRYREASQLFSAISQCLANNADNNTPCKNVANVPLPQSELGIFTGFHYGDTSYTSLSLCGPGGSGTQCPPSDDEMNYLFGLQCNTSTYNFTPASAEDYVVSWRFETGSGWANRCIGS